MKKTILAALSCLPLIVGAETMVGNNKASLPPEYLSVPEFKSCLSSQTVDTYEIWCLPKTKPEDCPVESWNKLQQLNLIPCLSDKSSVNQSVNGEKI